MSNWRNAILGNFAAGVSKLTLVADPDGLLTEEKTALELRGRGFDLIEFRDAVEFRYAYESKYRSIWDQGQHTDLVVILRLQDSGLAGLPYDLLHAGRQLAFSLGEIFPHLSYSVLEKIDRSFLDALFTAQCKSPPDRMGDNATKDYVLRHIFGIAPELVTNDVDLLRALLRLHYGKLQLPLMLAERLIQLLAGHHALRCWPLSAIISDDKAFFAFLQERWPVFLSRFATANQLREDVLPYGFTYPGPDRLPFDHHDIKIYIDNLFLEGKLSPVELRGIEVDAKSWVCTGIITPHIDKNEQRIEHLFELVEKNLPSSEVRHSDWTTFALQWAELSSLIYNGSSMAQQKRHKTFCEQLNAVFAEWLNDHYAGLMSLPPTHPAMLHHIPRCMVREMEDSGKCRSALIVVDGLALDQWVTIRQLLQKQSPHLLMRESALFAWVPTLTSVSRQAIFSGKPPLYFPASINTTNNEEKLWKQFWEGYGLSRLDVAYQRGLGDGDGASVLDTFINPSKTKVIGLVVSMVDNIMHGMQLGSAGMHNQITQWCKGGFLSALIGQLLEHGYAVWLTADHGNIQCLGKGRPAEGVIAETRGERVRIYPTPEFRSQVADAYPFATEWPPIGLPPEYFPLVARDDSAFVGHNESIVGHGGIAMEEVIVPFVKFEKRVL